MIQQLYNFSFKYFIIILFFKINFVIKLLLNLNESLKNTIFYFDPPYYFKGESLYMNYYNHDDHEEIRKMIKKIKNAEWIVSYDNVKEIRNIYKFCKKNLNKLQNI